MNVGDSFRINQFNGQMLTAILQDGSTLNWRLSPAPTPRNPLVGIGAGAIVTLHMVPEPSALLTLFIGLVSLSAGRHNMQRI
jgi:hypothetical protein